MQYQLRYMIIALFTNDTNHKLKGMLQKFSFQDGYPVEK
jgi:hypothetical protein